MANETNGTTAIPMGIDGPVSRTQGIGMGVPFKELLDEAPANAPELDFEGLESDEESDDHDDTDHSERDSDEESHRDKSDDRGDDSDEEEGKERRREVNDSKSKLISKLRARDRELQQLRRSERAKDRELAQLRESIKVGGGKSAIDKRDPGGSIVRMLKESLGSKDMSDKALNQLVKEHLTDALIDVQPELVEKDNNLKTRREQRLAEMALAEERAELRRMADEAKAERERLIRESEAAQHDDHARSEVKRFLEAEIERFPYLGVIPTAAEDLYEVLEEMAATGEHDFGPGPGQAKRVAEGFRLGAKRLNEYHKRQADIYGKVRGKPADEKMTGKITSPGKNAAVRGQQQRKATNGVGPRAIASRDDEPDPRLKFTEFVEQQERERKRSMRGR